MKLKLQKLLKENLLNFKLGNEFGHRSVGDKIESDCSFIVFRQKVKGLLKISN
jgi:hypothetical protein